MMYRQRRDMIEEMMINSFGPGLVAPLPSIYYYDWTKNQENKLKKKSFWSLGGGGESTT